MHTKFGPSEIKQIKLWLETREYGDFREGVQKCFYLSNRLGVGNLDKEIPKELFKIAYLNSSFLDARR